MAFTVGKRCSLCGGKLNGKKVCMECGLDNTKNDSIYKGMISQNECADEPLTHVHTHATDTQSERERLRQKDEMQQDFRDLKHRLQQKYGSADTYSLGTSGRTNSARRNNSRPKTKAGIVVWVIVLVFSISSVIFGIVESIIEENISWGITEDRLDSADYEYSTELSGGYYTVGVHLPEGLYDVQLLWGSYASVEIYIYEEGSVYTEEFWFFDDDEGTVMREELTVGMILRVSGEGAIECLSNDISNSELYGVENPLTDSYSVQAQAVAGVDFPAGTYDILYESISGDGEYYEYGSVKYEIRNGENHSTLIQDSIYIDGENGGQHYYNIPLMTGSVISVEGITEIILVPSEVVPPVASDDAGENSI